MDEAQVLSTAEAAAALGVSRERIRQLAASGALRARRSSAGWLIPADAVAERSGAHPGRPVSPRTAWAVLRVLDELRSESIPDRRLRHRARELVRALPDPVDNPSAAWRRVLAPRAQPERFWAHPGVLDELAADGRLSVGGSTAIQERAGLSDAAIRTYYVGRGDLDAAVGDYALRVDVEGELLLEIVPPGAHDALVPKPGEPVAAPVAAADLLEEADPRAQAAGARVLRACWRSTIESLDEPARRSAG